MESHPLLPEPSGVPFRKYEIVPASMSSMLPTMSPAHQLLSTCHYASFERLTLFPHFSIRVAFVVAVNMPAPLAALTNAKCFHDKVSGSNRHPSMLYEYASSPTPSPHSGLNWHMLLLQPI